jgi:dolichol-phosphate mannosyltransferase
VAPVYQVSRLSRRTTNVVGSSGSCVEHLWRGEPGHLGRDAGDTRNALAEQSGRRGDEAVNPGARRDSLVVIPTYNEAENLEHLVRRVLALSRFDVLIVDDNSPDGTGEIADRIASAYPLMVSVIHRAGKQGLGTAYRAGFVSALARGYAYVFEMDADFSHNPDALPALRSALNGADMVLGSRYVHGGQTRNWPALRRFVSQYGSHYAALVLGLPIHDLTGGFKGLSARVVRALDLDSLQSSGYAFQIEVTYRAYQRGFHIVEQPITFTDRRLGHSKMSVGIIAEALRIVVALRFGSTRQVLEKARP